MTGPAGSERTNILDLCYKNLSKTAAALLRVLETWPTRRSAAVPARGPCPLGEKTIRRLDPPDGTRALDRRCTRDLGAF